MVVRAQAPTQIAPAEAGIALMVATDLKGPPMNGSPEIFLQTAILLIGIGALALVLWEPRVEGMSRPLTV